MRLILFLLALPALAHAQADYTLLGAGVRTRPEFDGSSDRVVDVVPVVRYYGKPWFARTSQGILEGGARWNVRKDFDVGAQLAYEAGPLDHDPGASIGVHAEGDRMVGRVPLNGLVRIRQHLDTDRGVELDTRATIGVYGSHGVLAGVFMQATWASEKHFQKYYGVRESGLLYTSLGALASYDLTQRWLLVSSIEHRRLSSDAARSPIVHKQSGIYASAGLGYRF
ncbi:MAG TPA: MipA/OmpV family protein [Burkholderiales bacterium]|nr:MipA/OmpV family protein [Burkholderiales bacterium]